MEAPKVQNIRDYINPNSSNFQLLKNGTPITGGSRSFNFTDYYHYHLNLSLSERPSLEKVRLNLLKDKIDNELSHYVQYITIDTSVAKNCMYELAKRLASISFKDVAIEITPNNAVKFKIVLEDNKLLIINKPFEALMDLNSDEVIFSIFVNRELILSNVGATSEVVQAIQKYMGM